MILRYLIATGLVLNVALVVKSRPANNDDNEDSISTEDKQLDSSQKFQKLTKNLQLNGESERKIQESMISSETTNPNIMPHYPYFQYYPAQFKIVDRPSKPSQVLEPPIGGIIVRKKQEIICQSLSNSVYFNKNDGLPNSAARIEITQDVDFSIKLECNGVSKVLNLNRKNKQPEKYSTENVELKNSPANIPENNYYEVISLRNSKLQKNEEVFDKSVKNKIINYKDGNSREKLSTENSSQNYGEIVATLNNTRTNTNLNFKKNNLVKISANKNATTDEIIRYRNKRVDNAVMKPQNGIIFEPRNIRDEFSPEEKYLFDVNLNTSAAEKNFNSEKIARKNVILSPNEESSSSGNIPKGSRTGVTDNNEAINFNITRKNDGETREYSRKKSSTFAPNFPNNIRRNNKNESQIGILSTFKNFQERSSPRRLNHSEFRTNRLRSQIIRSENLPLYGRSVRGNRRNYSLEIPTINSQNLIEVEENKNFSRVLPLLYTDRKINTNFLLASPSLNTNAERNENPLLVSPSINNNVGRNENLPPVPPSLNTNVEINENPRLVSPSLNLEMNTEKEKSLRKSRNIRENSGKLANTKRTMSAENIEKPYVVYYSSPAGVLVRSGGSFAYTSLDENNFNNRKKKNVNLESFSEIKTAEEEKIPDDLRDSVIIERIKNLQPKNGFSEEVKKIIKDIFSMNELNAIKKIRQKNMKRKYESDYESSVSPINDFSINANDNLDLQNQIRETNISFINPESDSFIEESESSSTNDSADDSTRSLDRNTSQNNYSHLPIASKNIRLIGTAENGAGISRDYKNSDPDKKSSPTLAIEPLNLTESESLDYDSSEIDDEMIIPPKIPKTENLIFPGTEWNNSHEYLPPTMYGKPPSEASGRPPRPPILLPEESGKPTEPPSEMSELLPPELSESPVGPPSEINEIPPRPPSESSEIPPKPPSEVHEIPPKPSSEVTSERPPSQANERPLTRIILKPVSKSVAGDRGIALSAPISTAYVKRGDFVQIDYSPDTSAEAGKDGLAISRPRLVIHFIDR